jgi:hypothetical protein
MVQPNRDSGGSGHHSQTQVMVLPYGLVWKFKTRRELEGLKSSVYSKYKGLETPIFYGISIFPRKISSFSYGKIEIPWKIVVLKLALRRRF